MFNSREDWLRWRKTGIGGSDASIIMGKSEFRTPYELYLDKLSDSVDEEMNMIQRAGNEAEIKMRALLEIQMNKTFKAACVQSEQMAFMKASLDGWSEDKAEIAEFKLVGRDKWEDAKKGIVPESYFPQCQHNLSVSGAKICYYVCYLYDKKDMFLNNGLLPENMIVIAIEPDFEYIQKMIQKEAMFWACVQTKNPPAFSERDIKKVDGFQAETAKLEQLIEQAKAIEEEIDAIKSKIVSVLPDHPTCSVGSFVLTKQSKQGAIDYGAIPALKDMDLEQYRKKPGKPYWVWRNKK